MTQSFDLSKYVTVNERIQEFWKQYPVGKGRILTTMEYLGEPEEKKGRIAVIKAEILIDNAVVATGYAKEREGSYGANKTAFLENCETSAIGRALANLGMLIEKERPSKEEMANVQAFAEEVAKYLSLIKAVGVDSANTEVQQNIRNDWHDLKASAPQEIRAYYISLCDALGIEPVDD